MLLPSCARLALQVDHLAREAAPRPRAVHDDIISFLFAFRRRNANSCSTFYLDIRNTNTDDDGCAIRFHLAGKIIGNHRTIEVPIICRIACTDNGIRINHRKNLLDSVFIRDVFTRVTCGFCQCNTCLDAFFVFFIQCTDQRARLVKSSRSPFSFSILQYVSKP